MKIEFDEAAVPYTSGSQTARVWTERWVREWVFCPNCGNRNINQLPANSPVADFLCVACSEQYELKSQKSRFGRKVLDGAFGTMCKRLASSDNPNLLLLNYNRDQRAVTNLFVVPKHFFVREIIEERKPLPPTARRANWVGCNILLNGIPEAGKIFFVRDRLPQSKELVLAQWKKTLFLRDSGEDARGWLIEVMKCAKMIGRREFQLEEMYAFEDRLRAIYPGNNNIRPKIRQQLQFLRDKGYLEFLSRGYYRLRSPA